MYQKYYKLGLSYFMNRSLMGLKKPSIATYLLYFIVMGTIIAISSYI
jgi:hypothetical protein